MSEKLGSCHHIFSDTLACHWSLQANVQIYEEDVGTKQGLKKTQNQIRPYAKASHNHRYSLPTPLHLSADAQFPYLL